MRNANSLYYAAAFEKLGAIENWVKDKDFQLSGTHTYLGESLPSADELDFLIVMGGHSKCNRIR